MRIVWSSQANYTFYRTRNYLLQYRNNEIAQKFANEVLRIIDLISINPYLGKFRPDLECNEIIISKYTSLYYIINPNFIHLIRFYDNRQRPLTILDF
ncbi:plasmid stabilization system protein ParE [Flavobacterium sp. 90]|uniref:type II toxin-antitoxin system RelE/ParE family toxin n=1 Tax=unclassified Flavobacterium TaxID=196869 RepID=UPI000EB536B9|nr:MULTISPECIES: type II toxin-antitoxin system RelE/ParE family toxin [unclassified Flavobacterium]RKR09999.1 plasmid stabilization system protein ParE [Flavobacterium sp. 81]TCK53783.1 plasmid stabilization system protein ParE [Flavobacterium sp. 90]